MTTQAHDQATSSDDVRVGPVESAGPRRRWPDWCRVLLGVPMMLMAAISPVVVQFIPGAAAFGRSVTGWPLVGLALVQYGIASLTAFLLITLAMRYLDRRPLREAGLTVNRRSVPAFLLGLVVVTILVLAAFLLANLTGSLRPDPDIAGSGLSPAMTFVLRGIGLAFLLQGIPEELIWRGYVMQTLRTRPEVTVLISALVFASLHLLSSGGQQNFAERLLYLGPPFGFALLAGALVLRTGSVWSAVGVHGGSHLATVVAALFLGIGDGPAAWITQTVLYVLAALVFLRLGRRGTAASTPRPARDDRDRARESMS